LNGLGVLLGPGQGSSFWERGAPDVRRLVAWTGRAASSGLLLSWDTFVFACVLAGVCVVSSRAGCMGGGW